MSSLIVSKLEAAWASIRTENPDVPAVIIVTGRRRNKSELSTRAHICQDVWHTDVHEDKIAEVWMSGERLADGAEAVMTTLLHEAAHALAKARGIKDTSNGVRYHNKKFAALARELSLEPPEKSGGPALGYSDCTATDKTRELYKADIDALTEVLTLYAAPELEVHEKQRRPKRYAECACGEELRIPWPKAMEKRMEQTNEAGILCGVCRQLFEPQDPEY